MVNVGTLIVSYAVATSVAAGFTWTKCTNAPRCQSVEYPGGQGTGGKVEPEFYPKKPNVPKGSRFSYVGGYLFAYDDCTGYRYQPNDGYWYSHEKDGLFCSPTGFMRTAHKCNLVGITSKSQEVGTTWWMKWGGGDCCLPDEAATNIFDLEAYFTGDS